MYVLIFSGLLAAPLLASVGGGGRHNAGRARIVSATTAYTGKAPEGAEACETCLTNFRDES